jgi:hypothetical protein
MAISLTQALAINAVSSSATTNDILDWLHRYFLLPFLRIAPEKQITFRASIRQRGQSILWSLSKVLEMPADVFEDVKSSMKALEGDNAEAIKTYHRDLLNTENNTATVKGTITDKFDTLQFLRNMDKAGHSGFRTSLETAVLGECGTEGVTHFSLVLGINAKGYPTVLAFAPETQPAPEGVPEATPETATADAEDIF